MKLGVKVQLSVNQEAPGLEVAIKNRTQPAQKLISPEPISPDRPIATRDPSVQAGDLPGRWPFLRAPENKTVCRPRFWRLPQLQWGPEDGEAGFGHHLGRHASPASLLADVATA